MSIRFILLVSLCMVSAAPVLARGGGKGRTRVQSLPNGLSLILAPDDRAGGVDVTVWYPAGTSRETSGKTGLTHVVEQLMFRSVSQPGAPSYIARIEGLGGSAGSESTPDYSSFFETVPPEALETVFAMEADRMAALHVDAADLDYVRQLIRTNRERVENAPIVRGMQTLFAETFAGHPYAWPARGRGEDLDAITLDDCLAWHRARYAPNEAIVVVAGRFDPKDVIAAARSTLGKVPKRTLPRDRPAALGATPNGRRATASYAFAGPSLLLGWRVPGAAAPERAGLELLANYLTGDGAAALNRALIGQGRPTAYVQSGLEARRDAGLFYTVAALQAGADTVAIRDVEEKVVAEIEKVAREGLPAADLERVRKQMSVARLFGMQRAHDRGVALGSGRLLEGNAEAQEARYQRLLALSPDDIKAVAGRFLAADARVTVWMLPPPGTQKGGQP